MFAVNDDLLSSDQKKSETSDGASGRCNDGIDSHERAEAHEWYCG